MTTQTRAIEAQDVIDIIRKTSIAGAAHREIEPSATFYEQGIDSLDALTILLRVEEAFGVGVPDDAVETLDSVDALVAYLNSALQARAQA